MQEMMRKYQVRSKFAIATVPNLQTTYLTVVNFFVDALSDRLTSLFPELAELFLHPVLF